MPCQALVALLLAATAAAGAEMFDESVAVLDPFPREVPAGEEILIRGLLKGRYRTPELILIAPNGKTYLNKHNTITGVSFVFKVVFEEGYGPYRLEIMADSGNVLSSAARFTVWHGQRRPAAEKEPPPPEGPPIPKTVHERLVEKRLQGLFNDFRAGLRLRPLDWNEAVAARARTHADRMAKAGRRLHKFGGVGVVEMLAADGAGQDGLSGGSEGWLNVRSNFRPFLPLSPAPPGPNTWNEVVVFLTDDISLERMFEAYYVREAAFRICAADPFGEEIAIAAVRSPKDPRLFYFCVCFVQINDTTIVAAQDRAWQAVWKAAEARDPAALRRLGVWGRRSRALSLVSGLLDDRDPAVASAALDAFLLLDERKAREEFDRIERRAQAEVAKGAPGSAVARLRAFAQVEYDLELRKRAGK